MYSDSSETRIFLEKLCAEKKVECPEPKTTARMLDKVHFGISRIY